MSLITKIYFYLKIKTKKIPFFKIRFLFLTPKNYKIKKSLLHSISVKFSLAGQKKARKIFQKNKTNKEEVENTKFLISNNNQMKKLID